MKLPNGFAAIVDIQKIRGYCLSTEHPQGKHKARVFKAALGMTTEDSEELRDVLKNVIPSADAVSGTSDRYGARYIIDFELERSGKRAMIRSCWIVLSGENVPRFVTCFVL